MAILSIALIGQTRVTSESLDASGNPAPRVVLNLARGGHISFYPDEAVTVAGALLDAVAKLRRPPPG